MPAKKNRKYISNYKNSDKIYLVFYNDEHTKSSNNHSQGPYVDQDEAMDMMRTYLSQGICSWVVSYNG